MLSQNPENGVNVLSKFEYVPGDTAGTYESEEVLIITSEKASSVHASGWVGFAPSSYGAKEVSSGFRCFLLPRRSPARRAPPAPPAALSLSTTCSRRTTQTENTTQLLREGIMLMFFSSPYSRGI